VVNLNAQPATVALDSAPTRVLLSSGQATTAQHTVQLDGETFAVVAVAS
jgi:hypothetical protein